MSETSYCQSLGLTGANKWGRNHRREIDAPRSSTLTESIRMQVAICLSCCPQYGSIVD